MLKVRFFCLTMALALMWGSTVGRAAEQSDYIRLHIIANSDAQADQALKLEVRDAVREAAAGFLEGCADSDEAYETLYDQREALRQSAEARARVCGYEGAVAIEMGVFAFPDRMYGEELVPAGDYRAVRVILGAGAGRNWWCVIYPDMCLPEEAPDADGSVQFYSSVAEWLRGLFVKEGAGI